MSPQSLSSHPLLADVPTRPTAPCRRMVQLPALKPSHISPSIDYSRGDTTVSLSLSLPPHLITIILRYHPAPTHLDKPAIEPLLPLIIIIISQTGFLDAWSEIVVRAMHQPYITA
ncbi:hypothetical protein AX16_002500 [Volvariella volvacea WC 439]|nr:hypothetical protein AX16_002500 [Volvariella volvacea WC 439]